MSDSAQKLSRRKVFAGAGAAGALVAVAAAVPMVHREAPQVADAASEANKQQEESGYRLTEHVKNYYRTARV